jgi:oligopeptide/dipeptide ABC transporter ATP-binding protein
MTPLASPARVVRPLLDIRDLRVQFRSPRRTVRAVDGIDLTVAAGETVGLVGESGCGKSATVRAILRLHPEPATGYGTGGILFDGQDVLALPEPGIRAIRGRQIAMIFQDPMSSLNPVMTIGDQIAEGLSVHERLSREHRRERVIELLRLVGIPSAERRLSSFPHEFSGGMRQRVGIAIALACRPRLVLADEITTALDVMLQAQILDLLRDLSRRLGMATLMISHDLGVVAGMTERVYVMYAGRIVEAAATDTLFARPAMPYTWGLLRSAPNLEQPLQDRLASIPGLPPDLADPPHGCRFAARCAHAREICREREPHLARPVGSTDDHQARCWGTQTVPGGGWLVGHDWRGDASSTVGGGGPT